MLITGCNQQSKINISEALTKTEKEISNLDKVESTVSAFGGKNVKFRILMEEPPTKEDAIKLFNKTLDTISNFTNDSEIWNYYNAKLDISYGDEIKYEANKLADADLKVKAK